MGEAAKLSRHRLLHELLSLLKEKDPGPAFGLLETWGYLPLLHPELPWRDKLPVGVEPRVAAMALALGPEEGRRFIDSFPFEHQLRGELHEILSLAHGDKSPRVKPSPFVATAVRRAIARLAAAALKPCFLRGQDLLARGHKPGPEFHQIIDEAARLQRRGILRTRAEAIAWLKKRR